MSLSDTKIKAAKPAQKAYKLSDEKALFLLVTPKGGKYWRFKYRIGGKEKLLSLGVYPDVSLALARDYRDEARRLLQEGSDPSAAKQAQKQSQEEAQANSFETIAREWHQRYSNKWVKGHSDKIIMRLENDVFPWLGKRPITEIMPPEILTTLRRVENRGAIESAHRILQNCSQIFRYAIATGRAERDITADLRGALTPVKSKSLASITEPKEIGKLLRAIDAYEGHFVTKSALQLAPLVFVRPGELRQAEWSEINFESAEWHIPKSKMKGGEKHIVPLSTQALHILHELYPLTGNGHYVFPSMRTSQRPISNNTLTGALRRLGYSKEEMTAHGFRSMASTLLNEQNWHKDAIECQLAHTERNSVRASYNYAEYLPERRKMMQCWADYLDNIKYNGE